MSADLLYVVANRNCPRWVTIAPCFFAQQLTLSQSLAGTSTSTPKTARKDPMQVNRVAHLAPLQDLLLLEALLAPLRQAPSHPPRVSPLLRNQRLKPKPRPTSQYILHHIVHHCNTIMTTIGVHPLSTATLLGLLKVLPPIPLSVSLQKPLEALSLLFAQDNIFRSFSF